MCTLAYTHMCCTEKDQNSVTVTSANEDSIPAFLYLLCQYTSGSNGG